MKFWEGCGFGKGRGFEKSPCAVNLHNTVTASQQRLARRVTQLSAARMNEVCAALRFSLGYDSN